MRLPVPIGFAGISDIEQNGVLSPVWMTAEGHERLSLRALANCRYGSDRPGPENAGGTRRWPASPAHNSPFGNTVNPENSDCSLGPIR